MSSKLHLVLLAEVWVWGMMIIIASYLTSKEVASFDITTGVLSRMDRSALPDGARVSGTYGLVGRIHVVLYRKVDQLQLRVGERLFDHADMLKVSRRRVGEGFVLSIDMNGRQSVELAYEPVVLDPPLAMDETPFMEKEDFDFGLFLVNVLTDPRRRSRIFSLELSSGPQSKNSEYEFVHRMLHAVPELEDLYQEHLHDNEESLPHVLMGDVVRWLVDVYWARPSAEDSSSWIRLLRFLDVEYECGAGEIRNLIEVSVLENLPYPHERGSGLVQHLGPELQTVHRLHGN